MAFVARKLILLSLSFSRAASLAGVACLVVPLIGPAAMPGEARLQDLAYAREHYVLASNAFCSTARQRALHLIHDLEQRAAVLSDAEFLIGIERLAALAQNGHDSVQFIEGAWRPEGRLPLRIIWFPDAMVIARAGPPVRDLAGARIISIEGLTSDVLFSRLAELCGGNEGYQRWNVIWAVESQGILSALGMARSPDQIQFKLALPDGRQVERIVKMVPSNEIPAMRAVRLWSRELSAEEAHHGWRTAIDGGDEPLYLKDADEPFRLTALPAMNASYLQFRTNYDLNGYSIRAFAGKVQEKLAAHHSRNLIVDLRFDTGGDISRTAALMRELRNYVTGRIYLLIGRYTFSAGIVAAAIVKNSGGDRVRVIGENVGDRLRWWSEGRDACLPNSHLCLHVNDGLWDLSKGCAGEPDCYGDRFVPAIGSLDPEVSAPFTAAAWLSRRDPAMEIIEAELKKLPLR